MQGKILHDISLGIDFLAMAPKVQSVEAKIDKSDLSILTISNQKVQVQQRKQSTVKRQPTGWEKIFIIHISDIHYI